jgi:hypothetical protein
MLVISAPQIPDQQPLRMVEQQHHGRGAEQRRVERGGQRVGEGAIHRPVPSRAGGEMITRSDHAC